MDNTYVSQEVLVALNLEHQARTAAGESQEAVDDLIAMAPHPEHDMPLEQRRAAYRTAARKAKALSRTTKSARRELKKLSHAYSAAAR